MQKIKKSILFLLIGAMSVFCIEVFTNKDTFITSSSEKLDDLHESHIDQRINDHLDQLARKVQLQKLKAKSVAKEMELLEVSSPRLDLHQLNIDERSGNNANIGARRHQSLTDQVDAHINDMELEARRQAFQQQEEEEQKKELIKSYQERAKKAGFEMVIKDGQIVGIKQKNSFH